MFSIILSKNSIPTARPIGEPYWSNREPNGVQMGRFGHPEIAKTLIKHVVSAIPGPKFVYIRLGEFFLFERFFLFEQEKIIHMEKLRARIRSFLRGMSIFCDFPRACEACATPPCGGSPRRAATPARPLPADDHRAALPRPCDPPRRGSQRTHTEPARGLSARPLVQSCATPLRKRFSQW